MNRLGIPVRLGYKRRVSDYVVVIQNPGWILDDHPEFNSMCLIFSFYNRSEQFQECRHELGIYLFPQLKWHSIPFLGVNIRSK